MVIVMRNSKKEKVFYYLVKDDKDFSVEKYDTENYKGYWGSKDGYMGAEDGWHEEVSDEYYTDKALRAFFGIEPFSTRIDEELAEFARKLDNEGLKKLWRELNPLEIDGYKFG